MNTIRRAKLYARTLVPRTFWTVVERDGRPELVVWREWLGNAYDIASLAGDWGRWDRARIAAANDGQTTGGRT